MDSQRAVRMNPGEGETSYARNSILQSAEQSRMKPLVEEAIMEFCTATTALPSSMAIADLGCSSGPTALSLVSIAVDAVRREYLQLRRPPPELSLLLNDLPTNDFNALVKHLSAFQLKIQSGDDAAEGCAAPLVLSTVIPGSFHGRLFATASVHLAVSSNSLHWLSQAPEDLVKNGIPMYHSNEQMWQKTRTVVAAGYARQFRKDFMSFLEARAQEIVPGGRMVVSMAGIRSPDSGNKATQLWELVARILYDMASRGVIDSEKLKSFYIPVHMTSDKEVKEVIEEQGSFSICKFQVRDSMSGLNKDLIMDPKRRAYALRAGFESMIVEYFGPSREIMDDFVRTAEQQMDPAYMENEHASNARVFLAVSLVRNS